jgi:acyl-CoA synthetase (AMP-forming)/AMP-acid ligase II
MLYGAAARLGAIVVPVNWRLTADELAHVITDTAPKLLLADPQYQATRGAACRAARLDHLLFGFDAAEPGFMPYDDLLRSGPTAPRRLSTCLPTTVS